MWRARGPCNALSQNLHPYVLYKSLHANYTPICPLAFYCAALTGRVTCVSFNAPQNVRAGALHMKALTVTFKILFLSNTLFCCKLINSPMNSQSSTGMGIAFP